MDDLQPLRRTPFAVATALTLVIAIAVFRLPEEFIADLRAGRPFSAAQAGWIFRLLAAAAVAQAAYVAFAVLRPEKVEAARSRDSRLRTATPDEVVRSAARNAALVPLLTLVYGISNIALTGERGNFWLFLLLALAQLAWYYRSTGEIAAWMALQTQAPLDAPERGAPEAESADGERAEAGADAEEPGAEAGADAEEPGAEAGTADEGPGAEAGAGDEGPATGGDLSPEHTRRVPPAST